MLRRSFCCQHNKLTFSKSNWYNIALKAVLPEKICLQRATQFQYRATATVASVLVDGMQNERAARITSSSAVPLATPLEPLPFPLQKSLSPTIIVHNTKSVSHFKRCSGYRKYTGKPCTRLVKIDPTLPEKRYYLCHNHDPNLGYKPKEAGKNDRPPDGIKKMIFDNEAGHAIDKMPNEIHDCWQLWIGDHIAPKDRALIKRQMLLPPSERDKAGYIYAYHLQDGPRVSQMEYAYFKIGRTTDPHRRMYQVTHACNFVPKIIELIPSLSGISEKNNIPTPRMLTNLETVALEEKTATVAMHGSYGVSKCPMSHRVERLIHLELASVYENAGFKCDECGSVHREWIRVDRRKHLNGKLMTDQELWKSAIRPIVLKWIQFGVVASALK
ncbi:meiotically up-regulated gene 113-domain-containing protein [Parasitella parasitica]|nr:meiotically up-regulated gene 113-domain-containing protein [Parasitella parasitica]